MKEENFKNLLDELKSQLSIVEPFRFEYSVKRKATEITNENEPNEYEYEVPLCIFQNDGSVVAEIYDLTNESSPAIIERAFNNVNYADSQPVFVFFHNAGKWNGLSVYSQHYEKQEVLTNKNAYGQIQFDFSNLVQTDFSCDVKKYLWEVTIPEMVDQIKTFFVNQGFEKELIDGLRGKMKEWFAENNSDGDFEERIDRFLESLKAEQHPFDIGREKFRLSRQMESKFFMAILGGIDKSEIVRFTTLSSLGAILQHQSHRMWSIASMNDQTECSYSEQYVKGVTTDERQKDDEDSICTWVNNYITSCSQCDEDDLTMWRLYGDNTKGIGLVYEYNVNKLPNDFYLAPVSYPDDTDKDNRHHCLDFVRFLLGEHLEICHRSFYLNQWNVWKRFFKDKKYFVEKEVRLLYSPKMLPIFNQWSLTYSNVLSPYFDFPLCGENCFPLKIKKILIGPNCPEAEHNVALIKALLSDMGNKDCDVRWIKYLYYRP